MLSTEQIKTSEFQRKMLFHEGCFFCMFRGAIALELFIMHEI